MNIESLPKKPHIAGSTQYTGAFGDKQIRIVKFLNGLYDYIVVDRLGREHISKQLSKETIEKRLDKLC